MNFSVNKGPPAWMKTQRNSIGGNLRNDVYSVYAKYFVKYIQAYQAQNIGIYAITVQNEPLYAPTFFYKYDLINRNVYLWKNKPSSSGEFKWLIDCIKGRFLLE